MFELDEICNILSPFNFNLVGLDDNKPIYLPSKFPYTKNFIGKANNMPNKTTTEKYKLVKYQNWARSNLKLYYSLTYGYYNSQNIDMIPNNCVNLNWIERYIKLPRKIFSDDKWLDIIRKYKKYVINKNGVVIDCYNAGDIETIIFEESKGYLLFKVIFKQKGWVVDNNGKLVDDINGGEYTGIFNFNVLESCYDFSYLVSLQEYLETIYEMYNFLYECYADLVCGADIIKHLQKVNSIDSILYNNSIEDDNIEDYFQKKNQIGIRYTPKNLYKEGKRKTSRTSRETREKYFVTGHTRKLPDGQQPSPEALINANEYGLHISSGYTFVSPYYSGIEKVRSFYKKVVK